MPLLSWIEAEKQHTQTEQADKLRTFRQYQHQALVKRGVAATVLRRLGLAEHAANSSFFIVRQDHLGTISEESFTAEPDLVDLYEQYQSAWEPLTRLVQVQLLQPVASLDALPKTAITTIGVVHKNGDCKYTALWPSHFPLSGVDLESLAFVDELAGKLAQAACSGDIDIDKHLLVASPPLDFVDPVKLPGIPLV